MREQQTMTREVTEEVKIGDHKRLKISGFNKYEGKMTTKIADNNTMRTARRSIKGKEIAEQ